ncbi:MAG: hypothetical protein ABSA40_10350 [Candidatus Dormibacteria bacterium]|jgi:hypothetical protein
MVPLIRLLILLLAGGAGFLPFGWGGNSIALAVIRRRRARRSAAQAPFAQPSPARRRHLRRYYR